MRRLSRRCRTGGARAFEESPTAAARPRLALRPHLGRAEGLGHNGAVRPASDAIELVLDRGDLETALPTAVEARPDLNVDAGRNSLTGDSTILQPRARVPDLSGNQQSTVSRRSRVTAVVATHSTQSQLPIDACLPVRGTPASSSCGVTSAPRRGAGRGAGASTDSDLLVPHTRASRRACAVAGVHATRPHTAVDRDDAGRRLRFLAAHNITSVCVPTTPAV